MMISNHFIPCYTLLPLSSIFSSIKVFSSELALQIRWPKYWTFSFSISLPMNTQSWFHLRLTGLIPLKTKVLSRVFSNTTVQKHQFLGAQPSLQSNSQHPYMATGKTIAMTRWNFVGKVMSLLLNMLSRLVTAFLIVQLSRPYTTTGKAVAFTRRTFVGKVMAML